MRNVEIGLWTGSITLGHASRHGLYSQTFATFGATCVQNSAATASFHANAKTVGALATGNGGLVGAFHGVSKKMSRQKSQKSSTPTAQRLGIWQQKIVLSPSFQQILSVVSII